jgi:rod shape-determining protein MreD
MKNFIVYFFLYIVFCTLQFFFGKYFNIFGISPNFMLILVVYLGFTRGVVSAEIIGFLFGLTWDVFSTDVFGIRAVMFTVIGYIIGMINRNFDKDSLQAQVVIVLLANLAYWVGFSFIYWILHSGDNINSSFITVQSIFKILSTTLFAPAVFFILDRLDLFAAIEDT